jgi:hypothetical protein
LEKSGLAVTLSVDRAAVEISFIAAALFRRHAGPKLE